MKLGRWFRRFWPRLLAELNRMAGLGAVGAALVAVAALLDKGTLRTALMVIGLVVVIVAAAVAVRRALPPKLKSPDEVEGENLFLEDLASLDPPVPTLGFIGPEKVGKNYA